MSPKSVANGCRFIRLILLDDYSILSTDKRSEVDNPRLATLPLSELDSTPFRLSIRSERVLEELYDGLRKVMRTICLF